MNSPAIFQTIINNIFWNLIAEEIMTIYLDDILIFTRTLEEYYKTVYRVLETLAEYKLFLYSEKCKFNKLYIKYLGLVISENQVKINPIKVAGAWDWSTLTAHIELQVFLEFTNFYWRFICSFSNIAHLLFNITNSNST